MHQEAKKDKDNFPFLLPSPNTAKQKLMTHRFRGDKSLQKLIWGSACGWSCGTTHPAPSCQCRCHGFKSLQIPLSSLLFHSLSPSLSLSLSLSYPKKRMLSSAASYGFKKKLITWRIIMEEGVVNEC